jgi:hypothetical protein
MGFEPQMRPGIPYIHKVLPLSEVRQGKKQGKICKLVLNLTPLAHKFKKFTFRPPGPI